jgi:hypothetical protein
MFQQVSYLVEHEDVVFEVASKHGWCLRAGIDVGGEF